MNKYDIERAENELEACFLAAAMPEQAVTWCDYWGYKLIETVEYLSREVERLDALQSDAQIGRMVRALLKYGGGDMRISALEALTHD